MHGKLTKIKFKDEWEFNCLPNQASKSIHKQDLMEVVDIIQSRYRELPFINKFTLTPRIYSHDRTELLCYKIRTEA